MVRQEICKQAVMVFGNEHQILKAIEELGELSRALCRFMEDTTDKTRLREGNVCEEIADVGIMLDQLRWIFDESWVEHWEAEKLARLERMLEGQKATGTRK